jgi:hypothetical protein
VTFAVKRNPPPTPASAEEAEETVPLLEDGETLTLEDALVKVAN